MRHYSDLRAASPRFQRLFELQRQRDTQLKDHAKPEHDSLRPDIALRLRDQAIQSLRPVQSPEPR